MESGQGENHSFRHSLTHPPLNGSRSASMSLPPHRRRKRPRSPSSSDDDNFLERRRRTIVFGLKPFGSSIGRVTVKRKKRSRRRQRRKRLKPLDPPLLPASYSGSTVDEEEDVTVTHFLLRENRRMMRGVDDSLGSDSYSSTDTFSSSSEDDSDLDISNLDAREVEARRLRWGLGTAREPRGLIDVDEEVPLPVDDFLQPNLSLLSREGLRLRCESLCCWCYRKQGGRESSSRSQFFSSLFVRFGNFLYVLVFGWIMALAYILAGIGCFITVVCVPQGKLMFTFARYYLWPFDMFVERLEKDPTQPIVITNQRTAYPPPVMQFGSRDERLEALRAEAEAEEWRRQLEEEDRRSRALPFECSLVLFQILFVPILVFVHAVLLLFAWFGVVTITVAKLHYHGIKMVLLNPLRFRVRKHPPSPGADIALCVFRAVRLNYLKYSFYGMNIWLFNMLPLVAVTIIMGLFQGEKFTEEYSYLLLPMGLLSSIPLAYYIGKAVSSLAAQSSFAVGAFFNALFGNSMDLILYFVSLSQGLGLMVQKAFTGALLAVLLLLPGISMFSVGVRRKQPRFNKSAAGVSAALLFLACAGAFMPTIFHQVFGSSHFECDLCTSSDENITLAAFDCSGCVNYEKEHAFDPVFMYKTRPLMWVVAIVLPIAYIVGLVFSLKTHKHLYEKGEEEEEEEEEVEPVWSPVVCAIILCLAASLFAAVAEVMAVSMKAGLLALHIREEFAGVTLVALAPNFAEFLNAILEDDITLSLEVSNAKALQISLLQSSALVIFSQILFGWIMEEESLVFYLLFTKMDLIAVLFAILILNYIMIDRRTNYFRGIVLILVYCVFVAAYFFEYVVGNWTDNESHHSD